MAHLEYTWAKYVGLGDRSKKLPEESIAYPFSGENESEIGKTSSFGGVKAYLTRKLKISNKLGGATSSDG